MREEYDLATMKSRPNPYAKRLKKQVTLGISDTVIEYFEEISRVTGIPYEVLIDLYLRDCVASHRKLKLHWAS